MFAPFFRWRDENAALYGGLSGTGVGLISTADATAIITGKFQNQKKIYAE